MSYTMFDVFLLLKRLLVLCTLATYLQYVAIHQIQIKKLSKIKKIDRESTIIGFC